MNRVLALAAAALCILMSTASAHAACVGENALPGTPEFAAHAESATLCLINEQRVSRGRSALRVGPAALTAPAERYARQMVRGQFYDHVSPGGSTIEDRLASYTRPARSFTIGENLLWGEEDYGSPKEIVKGWMRSSGHRANILDRRFSEIGIGIAMGAPDASDVPESAATFVTVFGGRQMTTAQVRAAKKRAAKRASARR